MYVCLYTLVLLPLDCYFLFPLPFNNNNTEYINNLKSDKKRDSGVLSAEKLTEVATALQVYFDRALATILLYRFERNQYDDLAANNANERMSNIYGVEHFVRLFG